METIKLKCVNCNMIDEIDEETKKEIVCNMKKYKISDSSYFAYYMNPIRGKCLDGDRHSFGIEESSEKTIDSLVEKDDANKTESEKLDKEGEKLEKELDELKTKQKEIEAKIESGNTKIDALKTNRKQYLDEIEEMTGLGNIDIWK